MPIRKPTGKDNRITMDHDSFRQDDVTEEWHRSVVDEVAHSKLDQISDVLSAEVQLIASFSFMENGGSSDQNIDGSVTPVDFIIGPPAGQIWRLKSVGYSIQDMGTAGHSEFGDGLALTLGHNCFFEIDGAEYEFANITTNLDVAFVFRASVLGGTRQFLDDTNLFAGERFFDDYILLNGDTNDKVVFRVRDDLSNIDFLKTIIYYERVI